MSAAEALALARHAGIHVRVEGYDLELEAASPPPAKLLDALARHKAAIVALLRPGNDGWSGEDWRQFFDERAGIAEFDCGLPRDEAETQAFTCCVEQWLRRNPARSDLGRCYQERRANAMAALVAMGITVLAKVEDDIGNTWNS